MNKLTGLKKMKPFISSIFVITLLTGCGSIIKQPAPIMSYYQINYAPTAIKSQKTDKTILVKSFNVSAAYQRDTIVYRDDNYNIGFYPYKQWIAAPGDLITEAISRDLRDSGLFAGVISSSSLQRPDYILLGSLNEIGELKNSDGIHGNISIILTLVKQASTNSIEEIVLQKTYNESVKCASDNVEDVVKAISEATKTVSKDAINDIADAIKADN